MMRLLDGPCAGTYMVKSAPAFLRATKTPAGKTDVLNLPNDTAAANESIFVYQRIGEATQVHLNLRRAGSGFYASAEYRWLDDVDGEELRSNAAWNAWLVDGE